MYVVVTIMCGGMSLHLCPVGLQKSRSKEIETCINKEIETCIIFIAVWGKDHKILVARSGSNIIHFQEVQQY